MHGSYLVFLLSLLSSTHALTVTIPLNPPSSAVQVSTSLIGLSIEQDRWHDWVGRTARNDYFYNTLGNIAQLTGRPVPIRIGANTEDRATFNKGLQPSKNVPYPEASLVVGDKYYQAAQFLPPGTPVTWGLNLGKNNVTSAILQTESIIKAFASPAVSRAGIRLEFLEIGNEADLYRYNGVRSGGYSIDHYIQEWTRIASNVSTAANLKSSSTKFLGIAFAESSHQDSGFSPQSAFNSGLLASAAGSLISTISQHHYSGSFCSGSNGLLQDLMSKSSIRANLLPFKPDIAAVKAKGLGYIFGETNSYACHGAPGVSNTAGAAIWALDYALFASFIGIAQVLFHEGVGFKYNLVQPVTLTRSILDGTSLKSPLPPHIQPQYYSAIVVAEALGRGGGTKIVELSISDKFVAGYALYEGAKLSRTVLLNSQLYTTGPRGEVQLNIRFSGSGTQPKSLSVKRLAISHGLDTKGILWGGQSYETGSGKPSGSASAQTRPVSGHLPLKATEAILISFV